MKLLYDATKPPVDSGIIMLVDVRYGDAVAATGMYKLKTTVVFHLAYDTHMADALWWTEENKVAHVHVTAIYRQPLTPLVAAWASQSDVERLKNIAGKARTVERRGAHAASAVGTAEILTCFVYDLIACYVEESLKLWVRLIEGCKVGRSGQLVCRVWLTRERKGWENGNE